MPGVELERTRQALALIGKPKKDGKPHTPYSAAKFYKLAPGTIYAALKRREK